MRPLILIVVAAIALSSFPLPVFAEEPSSKLKHDIIEAKNIHPFDRDKILVSLCGAIKYQTGYHKTAAPKLDIPNIGEVRALAEKGNSVAQCNLGFAYDIGYGDSEPDEAKATTWFQRSADQGNPEAQVVLAGRYESGQGVKQDWAEAVKWYRRAAEQGHAGAQNSLGEIYDLGKGVAKDQSEAAKWYRRAARQGEFKGAYFLARYYRDGTSGTPKNYVQAYMWRIIERRLVRPMLSVDLSPEDIKNENEYITSYEQGMTAAQIEEAKRLAAEWKPTPELALAPAEATGKPETR